ncbi:hypothetical protein H0H93_015002 [Arthromyces matolae]|nr:hypothetical protein H0H93_015002 [Arthromyces matolae]
MKVNVAQSVLTFVLLSAMKVCAAPTHPTHALVMRNAQLSTDDNLYPRDTSSTPKASAEWTRLHEAMMKAYREHDAAKERVVTLKNRVGNARLIRDAVANRLEESKANLAKEEAELKKGEELEESTHKTWSAANDALRALEAH